MKWLLLLLLLLVGCTNLEGPFTVQEVIDGDTIRLEDSRKIRFSGINTPELSKNDCYAKEAKNFIIGLEGQEVYLESDFINSDKYGRYLRYVYYNDVNVNFLLVREGYAESYDEFKDSTKYYEEIKKLEDAAKIEIKGIWSCESDSSDREETIIERKKLFDVKKGVLIALLFISYILLNIILP